MFLNDEMAQNFGLNSFNGWTIQALAATDFGRGKLQKKKNLSVSNFACYLVGRVPILFRDVTAEAFVRVPTICLICKMM